MITCFHRSFSSCRFTNVETLKKWITNVVVLRERVQRGCVRVWFSDPSVWLWAALSLELRQGRRKRRKGNQKGGELPPVCVCLPCSLRKTQTHSPVSLSFFLGRLNPSSSQHGWVSFLTLYSVCSVNCSGYSINWWRETSGRCKSNLYTRWTNGSMMTPCVIKNIHR